jgi:hypothetical protein
MLYPGRPQPRTAKLHRLTQACCQSQNIVVIGGESTAHQEAHREVEAYDLVRDRWTSLSPLPVGRHGTQAAIIGGAVHIVAGSENRGGGPELDDHWVLD